MTKYYTAGLTKLVTSHGDQTKVTTTCDKSGGDLIASVASRMALQILLLILLLLLLLFYFYFFYPQ